MTQTDTSEAVETAPAPRLFWAKVAAGVLAIYAAIYAVILLSLSGNLSMRGDGIWFFGGMLALATTPFFAFFQLVRATRNDPNRPVRPILMALVMAAPAAFWLTLGFDDLDRTIRNPSDFFLMLGLAGMPALLSSILVGVFGWLAWRKYRKA